MDGSTFWKNFNLGTELQVSGSFIYNSLSIFDKMETFYHEEEIFEFLYNLSVGIERLLKINVILIEHNDDINQESFFESIRNHNHQGLIQRIQKKYTLKKSKPKGRLIQILGNFYNEMRYDRFTNKEPQRYDKEKQILIEFINKYLNIEIKNEFLNVTKNQIQIKKFIGEIVKSIVSEQYGILREEAHRLGIFVYEIRYLSKAYKIFIMEQFDFEFENRIQKEVLIKLINDDNLLLKEFLNEIKPLDFDNYDGNFYIKCILNRLTALNLDGELDVLYEETENLEERIEFLDCLGNEDVSFYFDDEDLN